MGAKQMEKIGSFYLAGIFDRVYACVPGYRLYAAPLPGDETELLSVEKIPARQALHLAEAGLLEDSKSLITMFWARPCWPAGMDLNIYLLSKRAASLPF